MYAILGGESWQRKSKGTYECCVTRSTMNTNGGTEN